MARWSHRTWIVIAAIGAVVLYSGMGRFPTRGASGGPLLPPPSTQPTNVPPTRLRLATFNIHSGIGTDDKCDLQRVANVLKGCDLVAMQEVAGERPWTTNEVVPIAKYLGLTPMFSPTETHWWCNIFGNGIMTRTLIDRWERIPLVNGYHMAHRSMVHLTLPFGKGTLNVLAVHMGKKSDRAQQFAAITAKFKSLPEPAVMMGDLNTRPYDAMMQALLKSGDIHDVVGERIAPVDRVDFILTRGLKCADAGLIVNDASDHPAAWAEIEAN